MGAVACWHYLCFSNSTVFAAAKPFTEPHYNIGSEQFFANSGKCVLEVMHLGQRYGILGRRCMVHCSVGWQSLQEWSLKQVAQYTIVYWREFIGI